MHHILALLVHLTIVVDDDDGDDGGGDDVMAAVDVGVVSVGDDLVQYQNLNVPMMLTTISGKNSVETFLV